MEMTNDDLRGWSGVEDLPSINEVNLFLAKQRSVDRQLLIKVAVRVPGFRVPSVLHAEGDIFLGLTFLTKSGSVLLVFPGDWPSDPACRMVRLYTMGNATANDYSGIACRFYDEFEKVVLPAEAHAADGG